jgi:ribose 5-phosphate isomerase A
MDQQMSALVTEALHFVPDGGRIGLGSGRTVAAFLQVLGERVRAGLQIRCVPASEATARRVHDLGIPMDSLESDEPLEVVLDGADEVERGSLNLIKGLGGALVRERIVAAAARRQVILVTAEKMVDRLGARRVLPVEVLPFAAPLCRRRIAQLPVPGGIQPTLRAVDGRLFVSNNGNWILDCAIGPLADPANLDKSLRAIPGVIDTGLFLGTADVVLVSEGNVVRELHRS